MNRRRLLSTGALVAAGGLWPAAAGPADGKDDAFTFVQLCDPQLGMGGYEHDVDSLRRAVTKINQLKTDFAVICGDLVHDADDRSFNDFKSITAKMTVPCYCVSGNHDVGNKPTPESLARYRKVIGKDYYCFEHKGYTFVMVNTQLWKSPLEGETAKHDAWLKKALATASAKQSPVLVIGHYPLFLKEPDEDEEYMNLPLARRAELLQLFEQNGVIAVLGGHVHRLLENEYHGIQLVNGETTSKNFDQRPLGFRLWHAGGGRSLHREFVEVIGD